MTHPGRFILSIALVCAFLGPAPHADEPAPKRTLVTRVYVAYDDLDFQKEADARVMLDRLKRAAYHACGGNPRLHYAYAVMPHQTVEFFKECREKAVSAAVAEINSPTLARILAETQFDANTAN